MNKRSITEWQALFEQHAASGLSAAAFCRGQGLCPKYFSLRRKQLRGELSAAKQKQPKQRAKAPAFVLAKRQLEAKAHITLRFGEIEVRLPSQVDAHWLSAFVVALRG